MNNLTRDAPLSLTFTIFYRTIHLLLTYLASAVKKEDQGVEEHSWKVGREKYLTHILAQAQHHIRASLPASEAESADGDLHVLTQC